MKQSNNRTIEQSNNEPPGRRKYIDLHTHSTASDGALTPKELVKKAKRTGLSALAITDHDQVGGVDEGLETGKEFQLEVIPGIEITSYLNIKQKSCEFHILGYFIDYNNKALLDYLKKVNKGRVERAKKMVNALSKMGFDIDWTAVRIKAQGAVGRPHIAKAVMEAEKNLQKLEKDFGYMPTVSDFIGEYLVSGKPAYFEKWACNPQQAVSLIKKCKGVPVLAHPCYDIPEGNEKLIKKFKKWGIIGLEAIYPYKNIQASKEKSKYFTKMAEKYNLLITGGSDYHGTESLGAGLGILNWGLEVPYQLLEDLKKAR